MCRGEDSPLPKKPEDWLEIASPQKSRGIFKLFLGYAPGVGKTFSMLSEALRRRSRGEEVVIGVVETHGRKGIEELLAQIESVPRQTIEYKGTIFEEMDVDAILARRPKWFWSTNWPIRISPEANTASVTRMCKSFWPQKSTWCPRSTFSTSKALRRSSAPSPASPCARRFRTGFRLLPPKR